MRPMTERPTEVDAQVILYTPGNGSQIGWIGRIPDDLADGWDLRDRAFADSREEYDEYPIGFTHGSLPWGAMESSNTSRPEPSDDSYIGWDYWEPIITEDPI